MTLSTLAADSIHDLTMKDIEGKDLALKTYAGKAVLIVNVASECGYTGQYAGLQALSEKMAAKGLVVLGVPCNDFGGQEPGSGKDIAAFCQSNYGVTFPLLEKQSVKDGPQQSPLYKWLGGATGKLPGWNFCKYLVGKDGAPIAFYNSNTAPDSAELAQAIEAALAK
jgi:glutathione peroxidase